MIDENTYLGDGSRSIHLLSPQPRIILSRRRRHHTQRRYIPIRQPKRRQNEHVNEIRVDNRRDKLAAGSPDVAEEEHGDEGSTGKGETEEFVGVVDEEAWVLTKDAAYPVEDVEDEKVEVVEHDRGEEYGWIIGVHRKNGSRDRWEDGL